jgi:hypothetical protein
LATISKVPKMIIKNVDRAPIIVTMVHCYFKFTLNLQFVPYKIRFSVENFFSTQVSAHIADYNAITTSCPTLESKPEHGFGVFSMSRWTAFHSTYTMYI